jgi:hypothetical protein
MSNPNPSSPPPSDPKPSGLNTKQIITGAAAALFGMLLYNSTKGTALQGPMNWFVGLLILGMVGFVVYVLLIKNKPLRKASADQQAQALRFQADPSAGVIYIFRKQYAGMLAGLDVLLNDQYIGQTRGYCFYRLVVVPGTHTLTGAANCKTPIALAIQAGQIAFVEQSLVTEPGPVRYQYQLINASDAIPRIQSCKMLLSELDVAMKG